ncbi:Uncharacterised protein [BD1-7 clade bacterium]|uniref:Zinc-ribbon domain-containing protein n=1 Tax=BD1-7 clade bacterium TaxID=2029982 RepID=A0A5S9QVK6_9GAMM|nr:Uncharacterised protein [BD1-7 clade bacterium]
MMAWNSETCFSKTTGNPLKEYVTEHDAELAADYAAIHFDNKGLAPYQCDRCNMWHLSPANRKTPSKPCLDCVSAVGESKQTYRNRQEAIMRADILYDEMGVDLKVYPCPYSKGWHLTKRI